ncbi:hypothetical protein Skr01_30130 [Sphaerisporangium krabiense]|nr:hypothetical protein Skr01_30130 [Sphaerisporangium krabiense]
MGEGMRDGAPRRRGTTRRGGLAGGRRDGVPGAEGRAGGGHRHAVDEVTPADPPVHAEAPGFRRVVVRARGPVFAGAVP